MQRFRFLKLSALSVVLLLTACSYYTHQLSVVDKARLKSKAVVLVLPFEDAPAGYESGAFVAEALSGYLVRIGHWEVIDPSLSRRLIYEQKLILSGMADSSAAAVGGALQADFVIKGRVHSYSSGKLGAFNSGIVKMDYTIISVRDETVLAEGSLDSNQGLKIILDQMSADLLKKVKP